MNDNIQEVERPSTWHFWIGEEQRMACNLFPSVRLQNRGLTTNPDAVNCGNCRRTRSWKDAMK